MGRSPLRVVCLCLAVILYGCSREEPAYEGKSTSEWLELLRSADIVTLKAALEALGNIGSTSEPPWPSASSGGSPHSCSVLRQGGSKVPLSVAAVGS